MVHGLFAQGPAVPNRAALEFAFPLVPGFVVHFFATLWLLSAIALVWKLRRELIGTTLLDAWCWAWAGSCLWMLGWCCEGIHAISDGVRDQIWYFTALTVLASLVSILGAKRPMSRVWSFVTVCMLLCLSWPALFSWLRGWPPAPLRLMAPALGGYAVVCVMGLGNYVGTRFLSSAFWLGLALFCLVLPYSDWSDHWGWTSARYRAWATAFLGMAIIWPVVWGTSSIRTLAPWDRVWVDFVNAFGIAWGRRLQERFNETARTAHWGVKLDFYGLTWSDDFATNSGSENREIVDVPKRSLNVEDEASENFPAPNLSIDDIHNSSPQATRPDAPEWSPEMIAALQWLLRRFVDQVWIDRRILTVPVKTNSNSNGKI